MGQGTEHLHRTSEPSGSVESAAERDARVRDEAALLAARKANFERGGGVDMQDVDAWLNALDTDSTASRLIPTASPKLSRG